MKSTQFVLDGFSEDEEPIENESDLEQLLTSALQSSLVQSTDWTTETIVRQVEKGRINLDPDFQRRDAWNEKRKSKFIESLILGFPVPQIVLAESKEERGHYLILDGKQRLLSLIQFAGDTDLREKFGSYKLKGLEILSQLNGKTFEDLGSGAVLPSPVEAFENRTIRTVVIRNWVEEDVLYHIFLRLNTESVQLSPQELRNALHPGKFAKFLDDCSANSKALRGILNSAKPDFRMRDAEILLRYYAFRFFMRDYKGSIKHFLDLTTESLNKSWESKEREIIAASEDFEFSVHLSQTIFGDKAFKKFKDGKFVDRFNRAVFDVIVYFFSDREIENACIGKKEEIVKAFEAMSTECPEFVDSVESTTKSVSAVETRFNTWGRYLGDCLGIELPKIALNGN